MTRPGAVLFAVLICAITFASSCVRSATELADTNEAIDRVNKYLRAREALLDRVGPRLARLAEQCGALDVDPRLVDAVKAGMLEVPDSMEAAAKKGFFKMSDVLYYHFPAARTQDAALRNSRAPAAESVQSHPRALGKLLEPSIEADGSSIKYIDPSVILGPRPEGSGEGAAPSSQASVESSQSADRNGGSADEAKEGADESK